MFGNNFDWKRGMAGFMGGQRGAYAYDANQRAGELHKLQMGQIQAQGQAAQQKQQQATRESVMGAAMQGAKYLRSMPVEQRTAMNGRAALEAFGVPPEMVGQFEAAGVFNDLSDATLDGFINSGNKQQTVKVNEVVLGHDNKVIYENRPNQVVSAGGVLSSGSGEALLSNPKAPDLPTGMMMGPDGPMPIPGYVDMQNQLTQFQTDEQIRAARSRPQGAGGPSYGKTPVYGTDAQGNSVLGVIGDDGTFKALDTGGVNVNSPYQTSYDRAKGAAEGKTNAEYTTSQRKALVEAPKTIEKIDRLLVGDLADGLNGSFGLDGFKKLIPGSKSADAWAIIQEIVGPQTLDELAKMKGVPSDRDIDLVKGAATALNDPKISQDEARRQLLVIKSSMERILSLPDVNVGNGAPNSQVSGSFTQDANGVFIHR